MTGRERILRAIDHQPTDRIPVDFGGHRSSGISVQSYIKLREALGLPPSKLYIYDFIQQLVLIEDDVYERIPTDVVQLGQVYLGRPDYWQDWTLEDGTPCKIPAYINVVRCDDGDVVYGEDGEVICIKKKGCLYFEQTCFPYADSDDEAFDDILQKLNKIMWWKLGVPPAPAGYDEAGLARMREDAKELRSKTDKAIYAIFGGNLVEMSQFAFRIDNIMCEMALNPDRVHKFLDKLMEMHRANLKKFVDAVGDYVDIIGFGDDMGTQNGPQFSPDMYREFYQPRHKELWSAVRRYNPNLRTNLHCCGSIDRLLDDIIDAGIDSINPVQISCSGMEPEHLKEKFGSRMAFWGGGCASNVCMSGTKEEIEAHVKHNIDVFSKGSGFIFQHVHNILANVPPENILAMFDTVRGYGR